MKTRKPRRVVILTALDLEYNAVREQLDGFTAYQHPAGTLFEIAGRPCCPKSVVIGVTGIGIPGAAVLTERAINVFQPEALLFVGIAGALVDELALGDVVVATKMYAFHGGKYQKGGFRARPHAWDAPHRLEQLARHVARTGAWNDGPDGTGTPPTVHFKPMAAGDVILNSRTTTLARQIRRHYDDAAAIEMEGAGVAQAGHLNQALPVLIIRGIADRTDGEKYAADCTVHQRAAAVHAARFAVGIASAIIHDPLGSGELIAPGAATPPVPPG
jgi:8-oxo-dGTP diphosphatase